MSKINPQFKKILLIVAPLGALLGIFYLFQLNQPRPLGDKLEYIGKTTSGSWLPMSSMSPRDTYYYGSDMSAPELISYFSKASITGKIKDSSSYSTFDLQTPSNRKVTITVHKDRNSNEGSYIPAQFAKTSKRYLVIVYDFDYEALKNSL